MVPARHASPLLRWGGEVSEAVGKGPDGPFSFAYTGLARLNAAFIAVEMKLSPEQEKKRLAQWLSKGEIYDPRNEEDYNTFVYGTEPIPGDRTWTRKSPPLEG